METNTEYLHRNIEDALALWELVIEDTHTGDCRLLDWINVGEGYCNGRSNAVSIAPILGRAYEQSITQESFDWEFLPRFFAILFDAYTKVTKPAELTQEIADAIANSINYDEAFYS